MELSNLSQQLVEQAARDGVQQLAVGGVIRDGDRVLLLRRPVDDFMGGIYELPSGKVEPGERLTEAVVREVREETGLAVTAIRDHLGSFDYLSGGGRKSRQFTFVVDVAAVEPVQLTEHDEYQWADLTEELPVTEAVRKVLSSEVGRAIDR